MIGKIAKSAVVILVLIAVVFLAGPHILGKNTPKSRGVVSSQQLVVPKIAGVRVLQESVNSQPGSPGQNLPVQATRTISELQETIPCKGENCELALQGYSTSICYPADYEGKPARDKAPYTPFVFLHGWLAQGQFYHYLCELVKDDFIVVLPSRANPASNDIKEGFYLLGEGSLTLLRKLNADPGSPLYQMVDFSKVAIGGHSLGGGTAIKFSQTEKVDTVVAIAPFVSEMGVEMSEDFVETLSGLMGIQDIPNQVPKLLEYLPQESQSDAAAYLANFFNLLGSPQAPTLFMVGSNDLRMTPALAVKELYAKTKLEKMFVTVKGANHMRFAHFPNPNEVASPWLNGIQVDQLFGVDINQLDKNVGDFLTEKGVDGRLEIDPNELEKITVKYIAAWLSYRLGGNLQALEILKSAASNPLVSEFEYDGQ